MVNKRILINGFIIQLLILYGCSSPKDYLKVSYIANCGFMYENQSSKIIIDPFGTEYGKNYFLPSHETKTELENGKKPFKDIDLVLISHIHGDHFNPCLAEKFLLNNKDAKMVCPQQVLNLIKDSCIYFKLIESQIISPNISMNNLAKMKINNVPVTAVRMQHGTNRSLKEVEFGDYTEYEKTENFGYLIIFDKKIIFHQGDACLKINKLALNKLKQNIDVAYLGCFDWDSISYNLLKNSLHAENIIFMHGTKSARELETEAFKVLKSKLIFFNHELESRSFK